MFVNTHIFASCGREINVCVLNHFFASFFLMNFKLILALE